MHFLQSKLSMNFGACLCSKFIIFVVSGVPMLITVLGDSGIDKSSPYCGRNQLIDNIDNFLKYFHFLLLQYNPSKKLFILRDDIVTQKSPAEGFSRFTLV
jgi:hypothetical protein